MDKFYGKYRIESTRLKSRDYGEAGLYFVTINTKNHQCYFGDVNPEPQNVNPEPQNVNPELQNVKPEPQNVNPEPQNLASEPQNLASEPQNLAALQATTIGRIAQEYWAEIPQHFPFVELGEFVIMPNHVHGIIRIKTQQATQHAPDGNEVRTGKFAPQSKNLGSIIRGFKAGVKSYATRNQIEFEWQTRYYDRIIRDDEALFSISRYIRNNPKKWLEAKSP